MKNKPIISILKSSGKTIAIYYIILFIISTLFPILASVSYIKSIQTLMGIMDVTIASLCFIGYYVLTLISNKEHGIEFYQKLIRSYKILYTFPLFILLLFLIGVHIKWDVLIIGLTWRMFLITMVLPDLLALLKPGVKEKIS